MGLPTKIRTMMANFSVQRMAAGVVPLQIRGLGARRQRSRRLGRMNSLMILFFRAGRPGGRRA